MRVNLVHQGFPQHFAAVPYGSAPVSAAAEAGMSFGTFLAGLTTVFGGVVLLDPKSSKEARALAQMALGASLPFLLNKAFALQTWPGQWN